MISCLHSSLSCLPLLLHPFPPSQGDLLPCPPPPLSAYLFIVFTVSLCLLSFLFLFLIHLLHRAPNPSLQPIPPSFTFSYPQVIPPLFLVSRRPLPLTLHSFHPPHPFLTPRPQLAPSRHLPCISRRLVTFASRPSCEIRKFTATRLFLIPLCIYARSSVN